MDVVRRVLLGVWRKWLQVELFYMNISPHLSVLLNQLVLLSLCERLLMPGQRSTSFYTLMFYNTITYCLTYVKEIYERKDWSMYINLTERSNVHHLAMSTTKAVLEWTKAVTFTITVILMILLFALKEGLANYTPTISYIFVTGFYYCTTEKLFKDIFMQWLEYKKYDYFENMEKLYFPVVLQIIQLTFSSILTFGCVFICPFRLTLLSCFTNIRIKYRELTEKSLVPLNKELSTLEPYRHATMEEVRIHDDVCAVCLAPMTCARITPCQHFFHADCLRQCLRETYKCPICQFKIRHAGLIRPPGYVR